MTKLPQSMIALTVPEEQAEIKAVKAIRLKRSFTMYGERFWRVNAPGHPNHESDLSLDGLKRWGIIKGETR